MGVIDSVMSRMGYVKPPPTPQQTITLEDLQRKFGGVNNVAYADLSPPSDAYSGISRNGIAEPSYGRKDIWCYKAYVGSPILRLVIDTLVREAFRPGWHLMPKFWYECDRCGYMYTGKTISKKYTECDYCGYSKVHEPHWHERKKAQDLCNTPRNENGEDLWSITRQTAYANAITDNGYYLVSNYYAHDDGELTDVIPRFVWSPTSSIIRRIANMDGQVGKDEKGYVWYVCPDGRHRQHAVAVPMSESPGCKGEGNDVACNMYGMEEYTPKCQECGMQMIRAVGAIRGLWGNSKIDYVVGEKELVVNGMFFSGGRIYGNPPPLTGEDEITMLKGSAQILAERLTSRRPTNSWLVIRDDNRMDVMDSLQLIADQKRRFADSPPILQMSADAPQDAVTTLNFNDDLKDLDIPTMHGIAKTTVHSLYGIRPIHARSEDKSTAQQDAAESSKTITAFQHHIERGLDRLFELHGINDFVLRFNPVEQTDIVRELQALGIAIDNSVKMGAALNYKYELDLDNPLKFNYSREPTEYANQASSRGTGADVNSETGQTTNLNDSTNPTGTPRNSTPSDIGGMGTGSDSSGPNTSGNQRRGNVM